MTFWYVAGYVDHLSHLWTCFVGMVGSLCCTRRKNNNCLCVVHNIS